jgi:hypothetical protein
MNKGVFYQMLEIRRGTAVRSYENTFFREFSENLRKMFEKYNLNGLLIANSECEVESRLQIDALLITNNCICLIDFKNFSGEIILPKNDKDFSEGKWVTKDKNIVKGGNSINPYKQLYAQKGRFSWVYHKHIKENIYTEDTANPSHTKKIICFHKPIELVGNIPNRDEIDFFITDSDTYLETIKDIIDVTDTDIKLSIKSFDAFKNIFRADPFIVKEDYKETLRYDASTTDLNYGNLLEDQLSALQEITEFVKSDSDEVFILQGTSLSGKSHLIPFIEEIAFNNNITQVEFFASSSRVAKNLLSDSKLNFNSIYSYIYGGTFQEAKNEENDNDPQEIETKNSSEEKLEIIPIKNSDNEDKALFIVDEAQLVSDNYHQANDLRFGSGKLLHDFIKYIDFMSTNRKLIFIGDSFQTTIGKKDETPLNPEYLTDRYNLQSRAFQLIDKGYKSIVVEQALTSVNGIRNTTYNQLSFKLSDNFKSIDTDEVSPLLNSNFENNSDFRLLSYSNEDAKKINEWIKRTIIKNGEDLAPEDLIIFSNNFNIEDQNNPFTEPKRIFNGQFGTVTKVGNIITEIIDQNAKIPIPIKFREVNITLNDSGEETEVLSLENYRLSKKGELSEDEIYCLRMLVENEINEQLAQNPFTESEDFLFISQSKEFKSEAGLNSNFIKKLLKDGRTKVESGNQKHLKNIINPAKKQHRKSIENQLRKDTSSKYYRYKNSAHLRFGWALTVNKAMSYKWDEVLFDVGKSENRGKTNRDYFKWLYTGLTRAREKVYLINYEGINPLYKISIKDANTGKKPDKNIYFIADFEAIHCDLTDSTICKFNFPEDKPLSVLIQLFQFLNAKLEPNKISINSINHPNYQELYELKGTNDEVAIISVYYNKKGQTKFPTIMKSNPKEFGDDVIKILRSDIGIKDFGFIKDKWREDCYKQINEQLIEIGAQFIYIIQSSFKDSIKITRDDSELFVEMNYDGDHFFSKINSTYYSNVEFWENFKNILTDIKEGC